MNISFINLDILAFITIFILTITSIFEGYKKEIIKLVSYGINVLLICLYKKIIINAINKNTVNIDVEFLKYLIFIILFVMNYIVLKNLITYLLKKHEKVKLKTERNSLFEFILSCIIGFLNSLIMVNLIICTLSLVINIDSDCTVVRLFNCVNKAIFSNSYLNYLNVFR